MEIPKRKQNRMNHYDYSSPGGYYVTICTHERRRILSEVVRKPDEGIPYVKLTELGELANVVLQEMGKGNGLHADTWVIMPDHIHMIVMKEVSSKESLGQFIGAFKSIVSNRWMKVCDMRGVCMGKLWQRNYFDHILRNEDDYIEKKQYMENNPVRWYEKYHR